MSQVPVADLVTAVRMAQRRFLYGLEKTPDDRLNWSPGGAAATPLELAGKMARSLDFMAHVFRHRTRPDRTGGPPPAPTNREEANARLEAAFGQLTELLTNVTEQDLRQEVPAPWRRPAPLGAVLWAAMGMVGYIQGQLNYLQLCYGDTDPNIPPDWGPP